MSQAASNVDVLANPENVKIMSNILKTNVSACTSIGSFFLPQLGRIWLDMLGLYKAVSGIISEQVATQGKLRLYGSRVVADIQDWLLPRHQKSVHYVRSRRRS
jgi:hypothetical protein